MVYSCFLYDNISLVRNVHETFDSNFNPGGRKKDRQCHQLTLQPFLKAGCTAWLDWIRNVGCTEPVAASEIAERVTAVKHVDCVGRSAVLQRTKPNIAGHASPLVRCDRGPQFLSSASASTRRVQWVCLRVSQASTRQWSRSVKSKNSWSWCPSILFAVV